MIELMINLYNSELFLIGFALFVAYIFIGCAFAGIAHLNDELENPLRTIFAWPFVCFGWIEP